MISFPALRHRNFRLFIAGQGISLIGTWMQRVALSWLVYRLTHSELLLGLVGFASMIPILPFAPIAGVLADRWSRQRMLLLTQVLSMVQALLLAALVLTGVVQIWHVLALSLLLGLINAFDMPIRQSFVIEMVEGRENLGNAIAINSSMFNFTRLVGPAIAGLLVAAVGEGICFLLNGLSYLAVIASLLAMSIPAQPRQAAASHVWHDLREGFVFSYRYATIRTVLLMLGVLSIVGMPYTVLMPVFAGDMLQGGSHTYGFLMAASGFGALGGALFMTSKWTLSSLGRIFITSLCIFSLALPAFAYSRLLWLSLLLMVLVGYGTTSFLAAGNTILQTVVDDDKRGRVMSFYTIALMGTFPIGSLLAGSLAEHIGAPITVAAGGVFCLLAAVSMARRLLALDGQYAPVEMAGVPNLPDDLPPRRNSAS